MGVEPAPDAHLPRDERVLGAKLRVQAGRATDRGRVGACDAQVEVQQRAVLELERAFELLGFHDRVDAELALVAMIGVLERALAALEQPSRAAVHKRRYRGED